MSKKKLNALNEKDFDLFLESYIEPPVEDIMGAVNPWSRAIKNIIWGVALTLVSLNFLGLDFILPVVGICLSFDGYRTLRRENAWFTAGYILTLAGALYRIFIFALHAAVYSENIAAEMNILFAAVSVVSGVLSILCACGGIGAVRKKAGLHVNVKECISLLVWFSVVLLLGFVNYSGFIISVIMTAAYVLIIRSLFNLSKELEKAGYAAETAPVRFESKWFAAGLILLIVVSIVFANFAFGKYPMEWKADVTSQNAQVRLVKESLIEKGFPKEIINDITDEDILACSEAVDVFVDIEDYSMKGDRRVIEGNTSKNAYDKKELRETGIAVQLPDNRWKIFHHFYWTQTPEFYGTEALLIWPADMRKPYNNPWISEGDFTGRVLYDLNGETFASDYYSLSRENYETNDIFFGQSRENSVIAEFSFPNKGEKQRGYVSYNVWERQSGWLFESWMNYYHLKTPLQYPVETAGAECKKGFTLGGREIFKRAQTALQFSVEGLPENMSGRKILKDTWK